MATERPSNLAADAVWPTRASKMTRERVIAGTGGVRIERSNVPIPAEPPADTPATFVGGHGHPPAPTTRDVRPSTRADDADGDDDTSRAVRGKGHKR